MIRVNLFILSSVLNVERQVDMLNTISTVCLVLAIVFLVVAVIEFFLMDIWKIILIRSGYAARKGIKILEAENSGSRKLGTGEMRKKHSMWNSAAPLEKPENVSRIVEMKNAAMPETSLLSENENNETSVLEQGYSQDYSNGNITMPLEEEMNIRIGRFVIIKDIMMIHTDEMI